MPPRTAAFPSASRPPAAAGPCRGTVPLLRHTETLGVSGQRTGAPTELSERGGLKSALSDADCLVPGWRGISGKGGVPNIL